MQNLELLYQIRAELLQKGFLRRPCIHVHAANGVQVATLEESAKKMQATIAPSAGVLGSGVLQAL